VSADPDPFAGLAGHRRERARLRAALARPAHAYLLCGPPGAGLDELADRFAAALAGVSPADAATHPDVREIAPEGTQIRIDQIRDLWHDVQMRPFSAARRVYLVRQAETMPELVQHALLKSIEEPPPHAVTILVTSAPQRLLATVRSRCETVAVGRLSSGEIASRLEAELGLDAESALRVARAAQGDADRARALALPGPAAERWELYRGLARASGEPDFDPGAAAAACERAARERGREETAVVEAETARRVEQIGGKAAAARERKAIEDAGRELARRRERAALVDEAMVVADCVAAWQRERLAAALAPGEAMRLDSEQREAAADAERALEAALDVRRSLATLTITPALAIEALFHRIAGRDRTTPLELS
jgi:DNA polymerase-3 subunit delta'